MSEADLVIFGTLIGVAAVLALIIFVGVRARRELEADNRALTVEMLRKRLGSRLPDGPFVWAVWQGLLSAGSFRLRLHDDKGALLTEVEYNALPRDGVLQSFEHAGRRYERANPGVLGKRLLLRAVQSGEILLSSRHAAFGARIYRAQTDDLLYEWTGLAAWHRATRLLHQGREVGRLLRLGSSGGTPLVLVMSEPLPPVPTLCFLLLSLP